MGSESESELEQEIFDPAKRIRPPSAEEERKRGRDWWAMIATVLVAMFVVAALVFVSVASRIISDLRQDLLENRAVECRVLIRLNGHIDPRGPCMEPEVLEFYDPAEVERIEELARNAET